MIFVKSPIHLSECALVLYFKSFNAVTSYLEKVKNDFKTNIKFKISQLVSIGWNVT